MRVDPIVNRKSSDAGAGDTYVQDNILYTSQWSSPDLKVGRTFDGQYLRRALVGFQPNVPAGATVLSANLWLREVSSPSCSPRPWTIHANTQSWGSGTVWGNAPAYNPTWAQASDVTAGYSSSCPVLDFATDLTALTVGWVNGSIPNHGVTIRAYDEGDTLAGKTFASAESGAAPTLEINYNRSPAKPTLTSPAADAVLTSRTPTLTTGAVTDPDGEAVQYWFRVSSGSNVVANSGWISSTSWVVPDGSLEDGGSYSWTVSAWDGVPGFDVASDPRSFTVDLRLGLREALPYDPAGPVQVNLATGNVVAGVASPSIPFVGGSAGVSFTYNSQAEPRTGLTGSYYNDPNSNGLIDAGEAAAVVRRDPLVQAGWGAGAPFPGVPGDRFNVRWSGFFTAPNAGTYSFGGSFDDALKVTVNQSTVVYDKVGVYSTANFDGAAGVPLAAGERIPIQVDYRELVGDAQVSLYVKGPVGAGGATDTKVVPTALLSPDAPALPRGWQVSADLDGGAGWTRATVAADQVTLVDSAGTAWVWRLASGGGFTPPKDQDGVLARDDAGRLTLHDSDGQVYVFNEAGRVASVTTPADDRNPAALSYGWEGSPARLVTITDPVSSTVGVRLRYRGFTAAGQSGDGCPTTPPSGLAAAPSGLLCALEYPDATSTVLWYTPGTAESAQLARLVDPGEEVTDLAYTAGRLSTVRDPLAADAVAAGVRADDDTTRTLITYDSAGRASTVTLPAPVAGAARPASTYTYPAGGARVVRAGGAAGDTTVSFGAAGYRPVVGDWDLNGTDTIGVYDNGTWYLRNSNTAGSADVAPFAYGIAAYRPVVGDWNNDNRDTVGLYDNGTWYLRNSNTAGSPDVAAFAFGIASYTPLVGDWDGNGTDTIGVYTGDTFYLRNSNTAGAADVVVGFGGAGYTPVVGDWDGNGTTTIGVRDVNGTILARNTNTPGPAELTVRLPGAGSVVAGDYDGTGGVTAGLYNAGAWTLLGSHYADRTVTVDSAGRVTADTDPTGRTTTSAWNPKDQPTSTTDPAGRVTTMTYDRAGRLSETSGPAPVGTPAGSTPKATTGYDETIAGLAKTWWANPTLSGTPALHGTAMPSQPYTASEGPPIGPGGAPKTDLWSLRLTGEINATTAGVYTFDFATQDNVRFYIDDQIVTDAWTTAPTTSTVTLSAGWHRLRLDYRDNDADGDANTLDLRWDLPGGTVALVPVPSGNLGPRYGLATTSTISGGETTTTAYDEPHLGHATASTLDPAGLALTETTTYEPHATAGSFLRRTSRTLPAGAGSTVSYAYYGATDTADDPCTTPVEAIPQAGRAKTTTAADPDGTGSEGSIVREQRYDTWGRVVATRVGTEAWTCSTFDARGRTLTVTYPAVGANPARTVTYNHAVAGNPLVGSVNDPAGTITSTVDLLGRVVAYTDVWNKTTTTAYDQLGRVTQTVGPAGTLAYTYDPAGRVETVRLDGNIVADPAYDSVGELASVAYPAGVGKTGNGTTLTGLTKDPAGRPTGLTWNLAGGVTVSDAVTRNQAGTITNETLDAAASTFTYDTAGRLTAATLPGHTYTYGYAPTGGCGIATDAGKNTNRTSLTVDGGTVVTYCYDHADRLTATTAPGYTGAIGYDPHGNTTTIAGETRTYDQADRHQTTTTGSTTVTYTRDATDRIVARNDGTTTTKYAYSASGDSGDATLDSTGAVTERTIPLLGGVLLTRRATSDVWSYPNLHGDIAVTANAAGIKQGSTLRWGPYGETLTTIPDNLTGQLDYGWLGQHQRPLEHQTGLVGTIEMGARQYDPTLGRFLETDPIEGGSANDYDYVNGDPVNASDLDGEVCWSCAVKKVRGAARRVGRAVAARLLPSSLIGRAVGGLVFMGCMVGLAGTTFGAGLAGGAACYVAGRAAGHLADRAFQGLNRSAKYQTYRTASRSRTYRSNRR